MDESAGEAGQKGKVIDGVTAALAVNAVPGEGFGADDMKPVEFARHAQAGFVGVGNGSLGDEVDEPDLESGQRVVGRDDGGLDGCLADEPAEKIGAHLSDALKRNELLAAQVDQPGVEERAVLRGGVDAGRECGRNLTTGVRTELDVDAVFDDDELLRRQLEDLSFVAAKQGLPAKVGAATARAALESVDDDEIRLVCGRQGAARMSALAARFAAAFCAQAFGVGLGVAVG